MKQRSYCDTTEKVEIYEKLQVSSMTEAVAKAINQKLFFGRVMRRVRKGKSL